MGDRVLKYPERKLLLNQNVLPTVRLNYEKPALHVLGILVC